MSQVCTIGLDIAKNKFQVHGEDRHGKKVFNRQLLSFCRQLEILHLVCFCYLRKNCEIFLLMIPMKFL